MDADIAITCFAIVVSRVKNISVLVCAALANYIKKVDCAFLQKNKL